MFSWLGRVLSSRKDNSNGGSSNRKRSNGDDQLDDKLLWSRDLEKHSCGEFSFAVVQANAVIEDHGQVESGGGGTFVGIYDGHGGPEASRFISDHLFPHLIRLARENGTISEEILKNAFAATEEGFLGLVRRARGIKPLIAAIGSCCLVGIISTGTLYVANLGDSRAVLGSLGSNNTKSKKKIFAEQLTKDHNASVEEVRQELKSTHPDDSHIVVMKHGAWRIKGIIQVSRSIGDAYLKTPEFCVDSSLSRFHLPEPISRPVLRSDPSIYTKTLQSKDKFIIFASDGLWEHITNEDAVNIVYKNPRTGIARRLVKLALTEAARKSRMSYEDLTKLEKGIRRVYHDDITVVVLFIDQNHDAGPAADLSLRGFGDSVGPSNFTVIA